MSSAGALRAVQLPRPSRAKVAESVGQNVPGPPVVAVEVRPIDEAVPVVGDGDRGVGAEFLVESG